MILAALERITDMETTVYFEICTGYDDEGELVYDEFGFEVQANVYEDKPDRSVGWPGGYEVTYEASYVMEKSNAFKAMFGDTTKEFTYAEMDFMLSLDGRDVDKVLTDHEDKVIEMYQKYVANNYDGPDYDDYVPEHYDGTGRY